MKFFYLFILTSLFITTKAFVNVYDNTNYDNSIIPDSIKECATYYRNNLTNKYNKHKSYYKVIPQLLAGYESIKNDDIYIKPNDMYSGKISIDEERQHSLYFWKFNKPKESENINSKKKDTLVLFINGGPGCSSMDGLLLENGPFRVNDNGKLIANEGSWHMHTDIVYLDQPLGTGFSNKLDSEETDLEFYDSDLEVDSSGHLIKFLLEYYKIFPEDFDKKLIIAGESYAGQYILHFTNNIWKFNKVVGSKIINLDTVMLGNAWVDPVEQSSAYLTFFKEEGLFNADNRLFKHLVSQQEQCQKIIDEVDINTLTTFDIGKCENIMYSFISSLYDSKESKCLNVYDYRLEESAPACGANWPKELPNVKKFFQKEGVEEALHIIDLDDDLDNNDDLISWRECSTRVGAHLKNEVSAVPAIRFLPQLLDEGLNLYLFNGDKDIICNRLGVENYVKKLFWNGQQFSRNAKWHSWTHENEQVGQFLKDRNVTLINIYNASHMVPYDKPNESRAMFHIMELLELEKNVERVNVADADYEINTFNINLKRENIVYYDTNGKAEEVYREDDEKEDEDNDDKDGGKEDESDDEDDNNKDNKGGDKSSDKGGDDSDDEDDDDDDDESDDEEDDDDDDDEKHNNTHKQEHSTLPSWILLLAFIALFAYIVKYILDTILLTNRSLRESSTSRLNGDSELGRAIKSSRLAENLEVGLGNSEFDIEMDDTTNKNINFHDDIELDKV
ncbi:hypothetical protein ACO0SA_000712 [Hanseniaspora valbyensis]